MDDDIYLSEGLKASTDALGKFIFYFVALAFTLLGLAIQTADFVSLDGRVYFELSGWTLLAVAGMIGLYRAGTLSRYFQRITAVEQLRRQMQGAADVLNRGGGTMRRTGHRGVEVLPAEIVMSEAFDSIRYAVKRRDRLHQAHGWAAGLQALAFVLGVASVAVARAWVPLAWLLAGSPQ